MGEMADYYIEQMMFAELEQDIIWAIRQERANKIKTWITKEGKELKIEDMETSHIKNCIALTERRGYPPIPEFDRVLKLRGEI